MSSDRMTVVPDFLGELDAGVFMNKIAAALNTTALGVLNNGTKGKVVLTFDIERMGNSVEEKRVKIKHKLNYVTPTPRGKASEEDTTETPMWVTLANPGHADNVASITLKKTAPFRALLQVNGDRLGQKEIAEWLEDWADFLSAFDADGNVLSIAQAAGAVRRVNIKQVSEAAHEDEDFGGRKSLMQSVEASSKDVMPVAFEFKCVPYEGLGERRFSLRNSLLKSGEPVFVLRIVQLEAQEEAIANEFRDLLIEKFTDKPVETFIGNFKA